MACVGDRCAARACRSPISCQMAPWSRGANSPPRVDLLGDHRAHRVIDRAGRGEGSAVVPSAQLEAADRDRGLSGCLQQDRDVDDPVLCAADDRVAAEQQHRHRSRRRIDGRDGLHRRLLDLDAIGRLRLLEGQVVRRAVRLPRLERDDGQAVSPHRHDRRDRCDRATHGRGRTSARARLRRCIGRAGHASPPSVR